MCKTDPRDKKLEDKLDKLFKPWEKKLKEKFDKELKEKGCKEFEFSKDGALPGYFKQKYKILSIGWESHSKTPNLNTLVEQFLSGGSAKGRDGGILREGKKNNLMCWKLAARIVYGLLNKEENWNRIPEKEDLEGPFRDRKFSFAVMNISKYANPDGPKPSDDFFKYVEASLGDNNSGRNFTREEIELLNPDLIFTWNIRDRLKNDKHNKGKDKDKAFRKLLTGNHKQDPKEISCDFLRNRAWVYKFDDGREIPLLDTWHLSGSYLRKKDPKEDIYDPVMEAFSSKVVQDLIAEKKAQDKKKG